ncbi:MAG: response regulator [Cyanobacteria bacterium P01_A01_bin.83]
MNTFLTTNGFNFDFNLKNHNILIVDDNPTNLSVIVDYLEESGLNILVSQDGESSLKRAKYAKPGIILLDVLMPGIDGYETCRRLKNDPQTQNIPIIFMTALSSIEDKVKGFEVGAVDYVTKPIQPAEVLARIKLHLQLRFMTQTLSRQNDVLKVEVEQRKAVQTKLRSINSKLEQEAQERIAAQQALKQLNLELEARVAKRTALLAQSNDKLQQEIIERKQIEIKLKNSLAEKEVLLKEIYHRVKNNLLVVSSLLELQSSAIEDPEMIRILQNSQERIYSMALVHEQLYRSENLQKINISHYLKALLDNISASHLNSDNRISLSVKIAEVNLNIETVNSCGLIVNELVTNALEHAFDSQQQGNIWLNLERQSSGKIVLTIKDDGKGMPPEFDFELAESLGLQLVSILIRQLEGTLELNLDQGTCFKITFTELDYRDRLETAGNI